MQTNSQRLADFLAAETMLARSDRVHFHHSPSNFCRYGREVVQERTPARIVNLFGEHAPGHAADVQLFDGDELVAVNDAARPFVREISPLVSDMLVHVLGFTDSLAPAVRPLDVARRFALYPTQASLGSLVPPGVGNLAIVYLHGRGVTCVRPRGVAFFVFPD